MAARRRQRGIALMLVLWVLSLLTIMAVGLTLTQRTELALADNQVADARFRALGDAALAYVALQILTPPPVTPDAETLVWQPDGAPRAWVFADTPVTIALFDEAARISLNQASPEHLAALLRVLGAEDDQAASLAAAIVDWRDEDDLRLLLGAEDADYLDAGRPFGAKDAPFAAVEELRQVLGMTDGLYRRLAPEVTADGNAPTANETFASPTVIAAQRGLTLEDAAAWIAQRNAPPDPGEAPVIALDRGGPLYRIAIAERADGHAGRRMEMLVEITGGAQPPYRLLWRRFARSADPSIPFDPE